MRMNRLALIALAVAPLALASSAVFAQAAPSGGIPGDFAFTGALATDYTFRGLSQTDGNPTAQATIDYTYMFGQNFGLYAGVFGSNATSTMATRPISSSIFTAGLRAQSEARTGKAA
ncbi:MAG: hypothetical protein EXQ88_06260 [Alphaproteobacteria bacterium]|nr:hypothetical protein [Alphaproteobacteria bacterium]